MSSSLTSGISITSTGEELPVIVPPTGEVLLLENKQGEAVRGEPSQFTVRGREGDTEVGDETGIYLRPAAARRFAAAAVMIT